MSTTKSRETAVAYSGKDGQRCTVLEITAGRVDVGADIGFLSQYPGEGEFLMQPLSCLEVRWAHDDNYMYIILAIYVYHIYIYILPYDQALWLCGRRVKGSGRF